MKHKPLFAALACLFSLNAQAADDVLDETVVTATRIRQPLDQSLSSTTVLNQADIQASQAADVPTILRSVAGVELSQNGGAGKASDIYLRGSNSNQVLILLDGARIGSATLGTSSIESLMLDQIERIEIVRGNMSSVYGSEAMGGVIQIFTKQGRGAPRFNMSAGAGSYNTQRVSAGYGGTLEDTSFQLQASAFKTDGVSAMNPALKPNANPDDDGYRNSSVSANLHHNLNQDHSVSVSLFKSTGTNQYDSAYGASTDLNTNTANISKASMSLDDHLTDSWQSHLQYAQGTDEYRDYLNGAPVSTGSLFQTINRQLTWQNTLLLGNTGQLLAGAESLSQSVDTDKATPYVVSQRTINSVFAGYTGDYGAHHAQLNLRQDNNSQYDVERTGLIGYGYALSSSWRATATYSTAFRAPTFNDLYYPSSGNPSIKPEHARNAEVGVHYAAVQQHFDLVYFDNHVQDLIVYPAPTYAVTNLNQARINGVEASYSQQIENTTIRASLTSQDPHDETTGKPLDRRAKLHSSLGLNQHLGKWTVGGEWLHSNERTDGSNILPSYDVLNATASYAIDREFTLSARADNLTNQEDNTAYGYNPLGRRLFVGLTYQP